MKMFAIAFLVCGMLCQAFCQEQFEPISLPGEMKSLQAFDLDDSLFVMYKEFNYPDDKKMGVWIPPMGPPQTFRFDDFPGEVLISVVKKGSDHYLYFPETQNSVVRLKALKIGAEGRSIVPEFITLSGVYVGSFRNKYLHVVCLDKTKDVFKIYVIDGMTAIQEHEVAFPAATKNVKAKRLSFFEGQGNIGGDEARIKIIHEGNVLYITDDNVASNKSSVCRIDLNTFAANVYSFEWPKTANWSTFVSGNALYRLIASDKTYLLDVYRLDTREKILSHQIDLVYTPASGSFARDGKEHTIKKHPNFAVAFKVPESRPTIVVSRHDGFNHIKLGFYFDNQKSTFFIPGTSLLSAAVSAGLMIATTSIRLATEGPGKHWYFYMIENADHTRISDVVQQSDASVIQIADEHESEFLKGREVKYKGYATGGNHLYGIYLFDGALRFVKY